MAKLEKQLEEFHELIIQMKFKLNSDDPINLAEHNMTPGQFLTGWILRKHELLTMSELADHLHASLSTATGLIDRLVRNKYVERERVDSDRRLVKIKLTKKGEKIVDELHQIKIRRFRSMLSALSEKDRASYLRIVRRLVEGLDNNNNIS